MWEDNRIVAGGCNKILQRWTSRRGSTSLSTELDTPSSVDVPEEEEIWDTFVRIQAVLGRGSSRDVFLRVCPEYISGLSGEWRAASLQFVNGKKTPGRFRLKGFERWWPELWQYGAGTIE